MIDRLNAFVVEVALFMPARMKERAQEGAKALRNQDGQAFVEYVLLLTVVAIAVALLQAWTGFVGSITSTLSHIGNVITSHNNDTTTPVTT
jgi:Flp pilus assembly pilin Flp